MPASSRALNETTLPRSRALPVPSSAFASSNYPLSSNNAPIPKKPGSTSFYNDYSQIQSTLARPQSQVAGDISLECEECSKWFVFHQSFANRGVAPPTRCNACQNQINTRNQPVGNANSCGHVSGEKGNGGSDKSSLTLFLTVTSHLLSKKSPAPTLFLALT